MIQLTKDVTSVSSRLVTLPQELFDAITAELSSDPVDIANLSVTCSYFWRVLLPRVKEVACAMQAPWAGDRLVFVEDWAAGIPKKL
ncbi:hypothetical protein F4677DRAFT_423171 [Hypoxylon crocopeplum]|nr:hypothetical protein F4677DRAFT_423171 [Hypoxylon crocopeplum]